MIPDTQTRDIIQFPAQLGELLTHLCRKERISPPLALLAVMATLLYRYAKSGEMLVCARASAPTTPPGRRDGADADSGSSAFTVSGSLTFQDIIRNNSRHEAGAAGPLHAHAIIESPVFGNIRSGPITLEFTVVANQFPGGQLQTTANGTSPKPDISIIVTQERSELTIAVECNRRDLASAGTRIILDHYQRLMRALLLFPSRQISEVEVVSEEEKRIVKEWGEGGGEGSRVRGVPEQIGRHAKENGQGIAVEDQRRRISYEELEEQANQAASWLRKRGVRAGSTVGLCLERGVELIVSMLGVMKAGAAYIPMEPTHPAGRLGWIVGDAKPALVVGEESVRQKLESAGVRGVEVVGIEQMKAEMAGESGKGVEEEIGEDQVAYVIYTSGTTGEPKGVAVRHGSLGSYIESAVEEWGIGREDVVLQFAAVSFDTAAEEVYVCLAGGGRLVVRDELMVNTAEEFMKRCAEKGVTVLDLPTAYWHELTAQAEERGLELAGTVRLVVIGGERALAHRASQWQRRYGKQARLINTYGPTETTIVATRYEFPAGWEAESEWEESPIGQPVKRARVYVLDGEQQLAPVGVAGELYIGGAGVSVGYVNRPDLTAERYVPDGYSGEAGARMYASGDLVRWRAGGVLEYVGRVDGQIKVRGFRVEVGEIESVLSRHPAVREAAVLLREDTPGNRRLVAYVVGSQKDSIKVSELRKHLAAQLPHYMVPAIFVALESLPKNRNGKVDRPSLPVPNNARPELDASYVAPRDGTEQTISLIWRDVLKTDRVGINDNFFDLGGNSLALIQVRSKLRDAFQKEILIVEMFEYPTIRALVERLTNLSDDRVRLQRVEELARKQKAAIHRYGQAARSIQ